MGQLEYVTSFRDLIVYRKARELQQMSPLQKLQKLNAKPPRCKENQDL